MGPASMQKGCRFGGLAVSIKDSDNEHAFAAVHHVFGYAGKLIGPRSFAHPRDCQRQVALAAMATLYAESRTAFLLHRTADKKR